MPKQKSLKFFYFRARSVAGRIVRKAYPRYLRAWANIPVMERGFRRAQGSTATTQQYSAIPAENPTFATEALNPLQKFFDSHKEGKGVWKWHHYFDIYHRHFAKFIGQEVNILEIGVYSGGSLEMWKQYFGPKCRIYGVDIQESCKAHESDSVQIFIGDQADRNFWKRFKQQVPHLDIVIDDGGHQTVQQIVTLEEMLPHLRSGGVYFCEDITRDTNKFAEYLHGVARNLNAWREQVISGDLTDRGGIAPDIPVGFPPTEFQRNIHSVHLYPFVAVIEKNQRPLTELTVAKHGTQWESFSLPGSPDATTPPSNGA